MEETLEEIDMKDRLIRRGALCFLCLILSACAVISPGKARYSPAAIPETTMERRDFVGTKDGAELYYIVQIEDIAVTLDMIFQQFALHFHPTFLHI